MAPKPNGFLLFMKQFKKREEGRGHKFPRGLKDVQDDAQCNREWQGLTKEEKAKYNQAAKQSHKDSKKKTGAGEVMDDVQKARKKEVEFTSKMHQEIEDAVAEGMEMGVLQHRKFFFIHSNWFYTLTLENGDFDYIPAEFAIAEFSLDLGVMNIYHEIIKTEIRCGYTREAMETSQETHQLVWNLPSAEDRFDVMCDKIIKFLKPYKVDGKYPPLFTSQKSSPPVKSLLKRLVDSKGLPDDIFVIYSLEILFSQLRNAAENENEFKTVMAEYELIKDTFSFVPGLDCDYHKSLDGTSQFCSMSTVKRWAFTICDCCCEKFGIKMINGIHYPKKVTILSEDTESLTDHLNKLALQDAIGIKSMTGVSNEHRMKVSQRSEAEEKKRREEKTQITVVNYAEKSSNVPAYNPPPPAHVPATSSSKTEEYLRPLRVPNTKSKSTIAAIVGEKSEHSFNDEDFPTLGFSAGRGKGNRNMRETKPTAGRGRGIALS